MTLKEKIWEHGKWYLPGGLYLKFPRAMYNAAKDSPENEYEQSSSLIKKVSKAEGGAAEGLRLWTGYSFATVPEAAGNEVAYGLGGYLVSTLVLALIVGYAKYINHKLNLENIVKDTGVS